MISIILNLITLLAIALFSVFLYLVSVKRVDIRRVDTWKEVEDILKPPHTDDVIAPGPELEPTYLAIEEKGPVRIDDILGADLEELESGRAPSYVDFIPA